jgi:hypothetical protein
MKIVFALIMVAVALWILSIQVDMQNQREAQQQELLK